LPGVCNPYCKVIIGHKVQLSQTKQQTQKPQYNQEFDLYVTNTPFAPWSLQQSQKI